MFNQHKKRRLCLQILYRKIDDLSIEAAGWITSQQTSLYFLPLLHTGLTLKSGPHCPASPCVAAVIPVPPAAVLPGYVGGGQGSLHPQWKADLWSRIYPLGTVTLERQVLSLILLWAIAG